MLNFHCRFSYSKLKSHAAKSRNGGQFHQRSTRSFYIHKFCVQLFCAYIIGLYFNGTRLLAQKLRVER
jgi:hypothetical protein